MAPKMTHKCEHCGRKDQDLLYCKETDEYLCEICLVEALDEIQCQEEAEDDADDQ